MAFDINNDGSLTYKSRAITESTLSSLVMTSDGKYMYVGGTSSEITTLRRAANGNLSVVGSFKNTDLEGIEFDNLDKLLVSPDNKTLYASTTFNDGHLHVFSINQATGALTSIQTLEHSALDNPPYQHTEHTQSQGVGGEGIAISSDGNFLYTIPSYYSSNTIGVFKRSSDGILEFKAYVQAPQSHVGTLSVVFSPSDIRLSPNQKFIYVLDSNIGNIAVWERNISSGDLTYIGAMNNKNSSANFTGGAGERISFSKDDIFLYTNNQSGLLVFDLRSDLDIVKSAPSNEVAPNGTISYTLGVTNNGPSDATNVVVTDNLPAGTSYVGGTVNSASGSCTMSGQTVTCDMGKFVVGDGYNAIIQVKAPTVEGTIINTAGVTSDQLDTETANNTDSANATIKEGGSTLPPVDDGGSGGGSLPLSILVLLIPALFRRTFRTQS